MKLVLRERKRIIALVLAILMVFTSIPIPAMAENLQEVSKEELIEEILEQAHSGEETPTEEGEGVEETTEELTEEAEAPEELNSEEATTEEDNAVELLNETEALAEGNFKVALRWGGTSNPEYTWDATKSEKRVIKLTFYYQNEVTPKAYAPGELVVTIPGIGKLNRESTKKAIDIAADVYGAAETKRDWSYKYDAKTDTYTFYNNHEIEQGATFNGSFEMLWEFNSRESINEYEQKLQATLKAGDQTISTPELSLNYTSKRDTFYVNKTAKSLVSADGLSKYVAEGKTVSDYAWVQYTFRYNVQELNARALQNRYLIDTLPEGCVIARDTNVIKNEDGTVSYKVLENTVSENNVRESSIIVGYPEEYIGQTIENTAYLYGTYKDEEEPVKLAESTVEVILERIKGQAVGIVPDKYISPDYIYREALGNDISFSTSLYATATTNSETEGYTVSITDDLLEIYTPANTESGKEAAYHTLTDDEYKFTSVTVPGTNSFTNANGYTLSEGDYTVKIYALYKKDVNTRGLEEYTLIHEGKWENSSITKTLEEDVVAIRAEVSGLKESIKSFYISARGTINVSENVENAVYENPSYIINYQFTELKDKEGNSLISDITEENYSQARLYERDSLIYGKGVLRAQDTITIREKVADPGYYYARADIIPFTIDENVEYFVTNLSHYTTVNNTNKKEISKVEVHGVVEKAELETLIETLSFTHSGLKFKNELSSDTDIVDYLRERAEITKDGKEISVIFDFSDNPIVSTSFNIGFTVDARLNYEKYYESTNPSYTVRTYSYLEDSGLQPQSTASHNEKTMATGSDSESILLALASHQQLIKMVKTQYTDDFVQEAAVAPMNTEYTYRLKLRNGYNTLVNTEIIDILEHSELTVVDGENPYPTSEWYGTFKNVDTNQIENQGLGTKVYYANTLTPTADSWTLMESNEDGIWTTENEVKAIKVEIEGEIAENSIIYADVNMIAPNDETLEDKKAYNSYIINSDAIDLYSGMQSTYMVKMPSNNVDVRLVQKEYNLEITKKDAISGTKLQGALFAIYDEAGNKIKSDITGLLGKITLTGLKEGIYTIKEEIVPSGYEKEFEELILTIQDGEYTVKEKYYEDIELDLTFTSTGDIPWTQKEDGTWQSNNTYIDSSNQNNSTTETMTSNEFTIAKEGTLSFDWAVSSESANYDYVYYTIRNAATNKEVSGTGTSTKIGGTGYGSAYESLKFNSVTKTLEPGTYKIEFTYRKDGSQYKGLDRAFVKNVKVDTKVPLEKEGVSGQATLEGNIPTISLSVENPRAKGSITVYKKDEYLNSNKEEIPLLGAQFEVLDMQGNVIAEGTTDANGNIVFEELDWGMVYAIREKEALQGYKLLEENINTYLSKLNKDKTVIIENTRKEGTAILTKQDEKDKTKLEGALYGVYAKNNIYDKEGNLIHEPDALIKEVKTNEEGQAIFENLIWGEYYIQEIETVYGYELSEEKYEFTVNAETVEANIEKTENEERSKANLQLIKIDEKGNFLPGVEFGLYTEAGKEVIITNTKLGQGELTFTSEGDYAWTQNEDGTWQSNNYHVHSTSTTMTSNEFTLPQPGTINFDWSVSSQGTSYDYAYYTITNIETGETIGGTSTKIGGTSYGTSYNSLAFNNVAQQLEAGTYKIEFTYLKNSSSNNGLDRAFVKNVKAEYEIPNITDENGQLNIQALEWGNYYIKEIKTLEGYELSDTKYLFTVDRETFKTGHNTVTVLENEETGEEISIIRNNRKKGKVTLIKYACDAEGNETETVLEGAIYELYSSEGKLIGEYTTNENGQIVVENLEWDSYYFLEKTAPTGYSISDKKISFVVNSKNASFEQELTAYNKQESGEIKINKTIPADTIYSAHGESTFIFKIVGKDENNEEKVTLYRTITFTEQDKENKDENGNLTKTITISNIEPYKYEITEEENYRYEIGEIIPVKNAEVNEDTGIINLIQATENKGEISFVNQKTSNSLLTDNGLITNTAQNQYYLIGITSELKTEQSYSIGTILTPDDFKYTLLYSGGQEVEKEASELENVTINGEATYTESLIGNHIANIQATYSGKTFETEIPIKWVMPSDYFTYKVLNSTEKTIAITGINTKYTSPEVLYIPSEYNGYKVTQVAGSSNSSSNKLANISNVKTVEIEEGIEKIGDYAFYNYTNIENVKLPDSVTSIGGSAFYNCSSLTSIDLSNTGVTSIGDSAFYGCSKLESIDLPASVTSIGETAFYNCRSLTSIDLPEGLISIGRLAFGRTGLKIIDLSNTGVTSIERETFQSCSSLTSVELPDSVTSIGEEVFQNCSKLESIDLSNTGITSIGSSAFSGCSSLTNVGDIPASVTSIGERAFKNCSKLESIDLSNTQITRIEYELFMQCKGLISIKLPESVTSIGTQAFYFCDSLTSIDLPESVINIEKNAFVGCDSLISIDLPASVINIGGNAFSSCDSLTSINVVEDNEYYSSIDGVLYNKDKTILIKYPEGKLDLTEYVVPASVTSIENSAFSSCSSLTSIDLSNTGVTSIGNSAFSSCRSLTSVGELPESLTSIGEYAFQNCSKLESIDLSNTEVTSIGSYTFYNCSSLISVGDMPESLTSIGDSAFSSCSSLTSIDLPESLTSIGDSAFNNCSSLTSIDLPESLTSIGNSAFRECKGLTSIDLPDSVTEIADEVFYNCSKLESIDLSNTGVTSIGKNAFRDCTRLESIDLPNGVTSIGEYAFYYCSKLTTINYYGTEEQFAAITVASGNTPFTNATVNYILPFEYIVLDENAKTIAITGITGNYTTKEHISIPSTFNGYNVVQIGDGTSSLSNIENTKVIEIEDGITTIANGAFSGSTNLEYIGLHSSIENIGENAFSECNSLKEIYYFGTQEQFNTIEIADGNINVPVNYPILEYKVLNSKLKTIAITGVMSEFADIETLYIPSEYYGYRVVQVGGTETSTSNKLVNISNVKTVEIEEGIEVIAPYAFYNYTNIENVKLPDSLTSIGDSAFNNCSSLTSIDLTNTGVTSIGEYAFYYCSSLTSVEDMPSSLTSIGNYAFYKCSSLTSIDLSNTQLTNIAVSAFNGCSSLTSIDLSNTGITSIGNQAFYGCKGLTSIDLPDSVTEIAGKVFDNCSKLTTINYYGTEEQFAAITVASGNTPFTNATVNYITE